MPHQLRSRPFDVPQRLVDVLAQHTVQRRVLEGLVTAHPSLAVEIAQLTEAARPAEDEADEEEDGEGEEKEVGEEDAEVVAE